MHRHAIPFAKSTAFVLLLGLSSWVSPQTASELPPWELKSPQVPKCDVWIEGEAFQRQEGGSVADDAECYGGKYWGVYTTKEDPISATYVFTLPKAGMWQLSMAGQPVGTGYTSPIRLGLDGAAPVAVPKAETSAVSWSSSKAVRWMHLLVTNLAAGEHRLTLEVVGKRPMDAQRAFRIDALALVRDPFSGVKLSPRIATDRPGNVYTTATPLVFRQARSMPGRELAYRVTDFLGAEVAAGQWKVSAPLTLADLAPGYYRLWYREADAKAWEAYIPFARVIDPAKRRLDPASPFCVDTAQSWLARDKNHPLFPTNAYALTSDLVVLAGLTMVRDRMSWNQVNPETHAFIWTNAYSTNARLLAERGVKVTSVYHDAPAWAKGRNGSVPEDLFALYRFSKEMVKQWGSMISAWEFWNEQDISFCKDPAWEFAAAQKAAFLGYKAADPGAKVLIGAAAANLPIPRYFENIFENGIAPYFDAFNFHIYRELHQYDALMADVTNFLGRYGAADKELWDRKTLFVTARKSVYSVPMEATGHVFTGPQ
ncbi:MAG: hypothetical protein J0L75_17015 [Spirochaetes bacterium]|nr:hypothetical protein [Spirochaetota bacterium]